MQANKQELYSQVLRTGRFQYLIPVYQRNYSWTEIECKALMRDIERIYDGIYSKHFVGSIIYKVEDGDSSKANVIDGQQRLSTMFLLCKAIHDVYDDEKIKNEMKKVLFNDFTDKSNLIPVKSDNEVYERIIANEFDYISRKDNQMYQNYLFFKKYLKESKIDAYDFISALRKLEVIVMELHSDDNPQVIFESINSTGLSLTNADLIRNYLLLGQDYETQNKLYQDYWYKFERVLGYDNINIFFEHYLNIMISSGTIARNRMYQIFKEFCLEKGYSSSDVFAELDKYVEVYKYLVNQEYTYELSNSKLTAKLKKCIEDVIELNTNVSWMFLMDVLLFHKEGNITDEELIYSFELVISYIFRRNVCNYPTNTFQKIFRFLFRQVQKNLDTVSYVDSLNHNIITTKALTNGKFPDNIEFQEDLSTRNLYGKFRQLKYLLISIENYRNKTVVIDENVTIEHVMPQKMTSYWQEVLGDNYEEKHADYVDDIGNLTLTSYNSTLSNRSFEEKLKILHEESHIKLNQYFNNVTKWDHEEIHKRSEILSSIACDIWGYPELSDEVIKNIRDAKYTQLTLGDLINSYESVDVEAMYINDSNRIEVNSLRDICEEFVAYCYKQDPTKYEIFMLENDRFTRYSKGKRIYTFSKSEYEGISQRYNKTSDSYLEVMRNGRGLVALAQNIADVYEVDYENIIFEVKTQTS